jgi:hypothetical protein
MLKAISIILTISGFIIVILYQNYQYDDKISEALWTNKQKKRSGLIIGYGCMILGAYLIIKNFLL